MLERHFTRPANVVAGMVGILVVLAAVPGFAHAPEQQFYTRWLLPFEFINFGVFLGIVYLWMDPPRRDRVRTKQLTVVALCLAASVVLGLAVAPKLAPEIAHVGPIGWVWLLGVPGLAFALWALQRRAGRSWQLVVASICATLSSLVAASYALGFAEVAAIWW